MQNNEFTTAGQIVAAPTITEQPARFISFEEARVQPLTLSMLERTQLEKDVYGNPLKGVYHFELVRRIVEMCNNHGYNVEIYDMFAAQNKERSAPGVVIIPEAEAKYGEKALEAHLLRRVFTNIRLTDFDDADHTTNLAVSFHQQGIEVGFGNMVKICHNQCMLGAEQYAATYSQRGKGRRGAGETTTVDDLYKIVDTWLTNARQIIVEEREIINEMKRISVTPAEVLEIVGILTVKRVQADTLNKKIRMAEGYPLNQSQLNKYVELLLLKQLKKPHLTVWDLYDCATELYKPMTMEQPNILPQNVIMANFLVDKFKLR